MEPAAALLLGVLQGLTEFLPVSSSGHLVLARSLLPEGALSSPGILFEVVAHGGTLAAALLVLRREVIAVLRSLLPSTAETAAEALEVRQGRRLLLLLLAAALPAGVVGIALADPIRDLFGGPTAAAAGLLLTGAVLLGARRTPSGETPEPDAEDAGAVTGRSMPTPGSLSNALFIGLAQAAAILPGVSRSGMTIVAGRMRGMSGGDAARFSFLLSAPVIAGAALFETAAALTGGTVAATASPGLVAVELALGFAAAFAAGLLALRWVFGWLARERFHQFGWYCLSLGGIGVGLSGA